MAIYSRSSSRPAALVVGLAGPTSWPNGLPIFLVDPCFVVKKYLYSLGASFGGNSTKMDGGEVMEVKVVVE